MKTPLKWLRQYVDIDVPVEEFTRRMIMCGFEVEDVEDRGAEVANVVVGRIIKLEKHPNADKLQICAIDVGGEKPLQIVTGATNVFEGAVVPVAMIGSKLPGGIEIKRSKLRGVESEGMLCSGQELNIDDGWYEGAEVDGILILHEDCPLGGDVKAIVGIAEPVIDFKITANRAADCMCVTGLAREAAVVLGKKLSEPINGYTEAGGSIADYVQVEIKDSSLCPRYMAKAVRNVSIEPSPLWMRQALAAAGVRPINNIVDITNYVMLETGQPMHAFDHRTIRGNRIIVRRASPGEKLLTLDEKERTLTGSMLVIADGEGPVGLAGIMGGEQSGIYDDTKTVVFECANFEWSQIRLTSRALGIRTESSARYEKALPQSLPEVALERALTLIQELNAGEIVSGVIDCRASVQEARKLKVEIPRITGILGQQIATERIVQIMETLGFGVALAGDTLSLDVPPWRQDVETWADIAEEVQRIHGYDSIPSIAPPGEALQGRRTRRQEQVYKLRNLLAGMGLNEALSYSFMAPQALDRLGLPEGDCLRDAVQILNPIGEDYSLMRTTMAPAMLRSIASNLSRKAQSVRLFELGRVYRPNPEGDPLELGGKYSLSTPAIETETLCIGIADDNQDFFSLKGIVEALLARFGIVGVEFKAGAAAYYHPGRSAEAWLGDCKLASLGQIHPDTAEAFEVGHAVLLAEVDVDGLLAFGSADEAIKPLPKFPSVTRDLAVSVDKLCPVGAMLETIRKAAKPLLEQVDLFDIYEGKQAGEGKKSVAFTMVMRAADRTLVDDEVNACFDTVVKALSSAFGAEIRK